MKKLNIFFSSFLIYFFTVTVLFAADNRQSSFISKVHEGHLCARNSSWLAAKNITMKMFSEKLQQSYSFEIKLYDNNDMYLVLNGAGFNKDNLPAEAILVAGRVLVTKNVDIEENYAIDVLDGAALFQQLAMTLIELSAHDGPMKTQYPLTIKISEKEYPIKATTQSANALFNAPWNATVNLKKGKEESIFYKIDFSYKNEGKDSDIHMEGILSNYGTKNVNKYLEDNFQVSNWKQYNIGRYSKKLDKGTIYDFGTTFIEKPYKTLGALRKYINERYKK